MCFSAPASFAAGVGLLAIATVTNRIIRKPLLKHLLIIPLLFSAQQFTEGVVWLSLGGTLTPVLVVPFTYFYLFCAYLLWPVWSPITSYFLERDPLRKKLILSFLAIGSLVSLSLLYMLINYGPQAEIINCHIYYGLALPFNLSLALFCLYFIATVFPMFVSSVRGLPLLGIVFTGSFLAVYYFYTLHFISVWCFFAAIISGLVYLVVQWNNE